MKWIAAVVALFALTHLLVRVRRFHRVWYHHA
jgi:hypothetical protein